MNPLPHFRARLLGSLLMVLLLAAGVGRAAAEPLTIYAAMGYDQAVADAFTRATGIAVKLSFEAQLRDAIQSAVRFPEAARMMHLSGRTLVAFDWQDGRISHLRIVRSSGVGSLDLAALHTVQVAAYPSTPSILAGRLLAFQVWVQFTLHDD